MRYPPNRKFKTASKVRPPAVAIIAFAYLYTVRGFAQVASAHTTTFDLETATVVDINVAIDAGALSSEKLIRLYLGRIEAYDKKGPKINSVITLNPRSTTFAAACSVSCLTH